MPGCGTLGRKSAADPTPGAAVDARDVPGLTRRRNGITILNYKYDTTVAQQDFTTPFYCRSMKLCWFYGTREGHSSLGNDPRGVRIWAFWWAQFRTIITIIYLGDPAVGGIWAARDLVKTRPDARLGIWIVWFMNFWVGFLMLANFWHCINVWKGL